jgi:hydroquinone glucosyltransferase
VLESLVNGVPLIVWPLYAEQRMNSVLLTEDVKVAIKPIQDDSDIIGREEVSRIVRCLIKEKEEERLRGRAEELGRVASNALDGGSSFNNLSRVTTLWKTSVM